MGLQVSEGTLPFHALLPPPRSANPFRPPPSDLPLPPSSSPPRPSPDKTAPELRAILDRLSDENRELKTALERSKAEALGARTAAEGLQRALRERESDLAASRQAVASLQGDQAELRDKVTSLHEQASACTEEGWICPPGFVRLALLCRAWRAPDLHVLLSGPADI